MRGFFCFKQGGQTCNSLTTSSCFDPASPLSAEFCQETGTKHQLKTSYAFSVKQKRKEEEGGEDDGKWGEEIQPWSNFAFKASCQGSPLSSHLPRRKSKGAPACRLRTRGISHQTAPSVTWHIRPSPALAFPRASVKARDREPEQHILSEDGLSTSPTSSDDKNPLLWAIRLGTKQNKSSKDSGH